jgi:hypothetical protein
MIITFKMILIFFSAIPFQAIFWRNKMDPMPLIILKTQILCNKTLCFMIYFCTMFYGAQVFCDVWSYTSQMYFFRVTQNHPNFSTNRKACYIENYMIHIIPIIMFGKYQILLRTPFIIHVRLIITHLSLNTYLLKFIFNNFTTQMSRQFCFVCLLSPIQLWRRL